MTLTELCLVRERMTRKKPRADLPVFFGAGCLVRNQRGDLRTPHLQAGKSSATSKGISKTRI